MEFDTFDSVLKNVGGFGFYQKRCLVITCISSMVMGIATHIIVLVLETPPFIPGDCEVVNSNFTNIIYNTNDTAMQNSLVTEYDLICKNDTFIKMIQTFWMVGTLIACFLTFIPDKYGRTVPSFIACLTMGLCFLILSFSGQFGTEAVYFYAFWTMIFGISFPFQWMVSYIYITEITDRKNKGKAGAIVNAFYPGGVIFLAILAYFVDDWRNLLRIFGVLALLYLPLRYYYFYESPLYLHSKGGEEAVQESFTVLMKIRQINKNRKILENCLSSKEEEEASDALIDQLRNLFETENASMRIQSPSSNKKYFELFKNGIEMTRTTIILCFCWGTVYAVYIGQTFSLGSLPGGLIGNLIFAALSDILGSFLYKVLMDWERLGRRGTIILSNLVIGFLLISTTIVDNRGSLSSGTERGIVVATPLQKLLILLFSFCARIFLYMNWCVVQQIANEVYPTEIKASAVGFINIIATVFTLFSPSIIHLRKHKDWLPNSIFAGACFLAGFLSYFLPESLGRYVHTFKDALELYSAQ